MEIHYQDIDIPRLRNSIRDIDGIVNIHDFHAWQLTDGLIISSLHVVCEQGCNFSAAAKKIKKILHKAGIHSTAIQPEFVPLEPAEVCTHQAPFYRLALTFLNSPSLWIVVKRIVWRTAKRIGAARRRVGKRSRKVPLPTERRRAMVLSIRTLIN